MADDKIEVDYTRVNEVMNELKTLGVSLNCSENLHKKLLSIDKSATGLMEIGGDESPAKSGVMRLYPTAELLRIRDELRAKNLDCLVVESD
jgi:hypothetical protein